MTEQINQETGEVTQIPDQTPSPEPSMEAPSGLLPSDLTSMGITAKEYSAIESAAESADRLPPFYEATPFRAGPKNDQGVWDYLWAVPLTRWGNKKTPNPPDCPRFDKGGYLSALVLIARKVKSEKTGQTVPGFLELVYYNRSPLGPNEIPSARGPVYSKTVQAKNPEGQVTFTEKVLFPPIEVVVGILKFTVSPVMKDNLGNDYQIRSFEGHGPSFNHFIQIREKLFTRAELDERQELTDEQRKKMVGTFSGKYSLRHTISNRPPTPTGTSQPTQQQTPTQEELQTSGAPEIPF